LNISTNIAHPNQIKSQLMCKLCTNDSKSKALEIYLLNPV
jgi:hypothetical protein